MNPSDNLIRVENMQDKIDILKVIEWSRKRNIAFENLTELQLAEAFLDIVYFPELSE
jgi:hypothetical protein